MAELDITNLPILEDDDEEIESPVLMPQYNLPEKKQGVIDPATGQIKDMSELTPWDYIKAMATTMNVPIKDPKSGCKHCYGRGWTGKVAKTGQPIPCSCIYPPQTAEQRFNEQNSQMALKSRLSSMSRDQRRRMQKNLFKGTKKSATKALNQEVVELGKELS